MQPTVTGRRLLTTLSSKIHPQLPLSPRESQQLLNLLTTSFRTHLDQAHPVASSENVAQKPPMALKGNAWRESPSANATSSYTAASRHMDSILTNPLFAVKPQRRGSDSTAIEVLRDPLVWFVNEVAAGSATLSKAAMCLAILVQTPEAKVEGGKRVASIFADWLNTSGLENSREFVEMCVGRTGQSLNFLDQLVVLLLKEHETDAIWRWFVRPTEDRTKETGLKTAKIVAFRKALLVQMVGTKKNSSIDMGMTTFLQAYRVSGFVGDQRAYNVLRPAGTHIVNRIILEGTQNADPKLYQSFLASLEDWLGEWSQAVRPMLWLHHPSKRSALPGLQFIKDPAGAVNLVNSSQSRQHFLVKLGLGVARQLMIEQKYAESLVAMKFITDHFAHIVSSEAAPEVRKPSTARWKARREQENLELLNSLVPT